MRRIVYLSGTRADFGLMASTLRCIQQEPGLSVSVAVTGMHLAAEHGHTVDEIVASGLPICGRVPFDVATRTGASMALGIAECLRGVTQLLADEKPDALVLLGDRGEMLAGSIAALHVGVPCVHIHGGERSGTVDEPVRHAISKLSTFHFVATEEARGRLLRMGELADRIFVTGAPGLDGLLDLGDMRRDECLAQLQLAPQAPFALVLFHPVVQQAAQAVAQVRAVADAVRKAGLPVVWLDPNADAGSGEILQGLADAELPPGSRRVRHLPRPLFAAALRHCEVLVGNSSSGIIEAATFGTPVVNIGDRQSCRTHGTNVLDVAPDAAAIAGAIESQRRHGRYAWENAWGDGRSGPRITRLLAQLPLAPGVLEKTNTY